MLKNGGQQQEKIKNVYVEGGVFSMDWKSTGLTPATTPTGSANTTPINSPNKLEKVELTDKNKSNSIPIGKNPKKLTFSYDDIASPPNDQLTGLLDHLIKVKIESGEQSAKTNKISP